jgi:hypothetical protein
MTAAKGSTRTPLGPKLYLYILNKLFYYAAKNLPYAIEYNFSEYFIQNEYIIWSYASSWRNIKENILVRTECVHQCNEVAIIYLSFSSLWAIYYEQTWSLIG